MVAVAVPALAAEPTAHIPGKRLVNGHRAVPQLADIGIGAYGAFRVVVAVVVDVLPQAPVVWLHVPFQVGVIRPGRVHLNPVLGLDRALMVTF